MPTNLYFNNYPKKITSEQLLVEDLIIEALKIHSMDIFYLPLSSLNGTDLLFGEDNSKQYTSAFPIEMYLENVLSMDGEGDVITRFGLEIKDECTLLVSRRRFKSVIPQIRPNEGDLIYIPLFQNFFEITFVEHENTQAMFYTLGRGRGGNVYVYALKLKQFTFSNEYIKTGVKEVDEQIRDHYVRTRVYLTNISGKFLNDEIVYQGDTLESSTCKGYVYDYKDGLYIDIYRPNGVFSPGIITSVTTGSTANVVSASDNDIFDNMFEDIIDNKRLDIESALNIDFTETNPFGDK